MQIAEARIKEMIIEKYGSIKKFCEIIDMPWTTLDSILKRGISNSNITNVMKITKELKIDTESLASGIIIDAMERPDSGQSERPHTIAAHFSGDEYTEEELNKIKEFAAFVKASRK